MASRRPRSRTSEAAQARPHTGVMFRRERVAAMPGTKKPTTPRAHRSKRVIARQAGYLSEGRWVLIRGSM